jgi:hypothetical protein
VPPRPCRQVDHAPNSESASAKTGRGGRLSAASSGIATVAQGFQMRENSLSMSFGIDFLRRLSFEAGQRLMAEPQPCLAVSPPRRSDAVAMTTATSPRRSCTAGDVAQW